MASQAASRPPSGDSTRQERHFIITLSRVWAWVFLAILIIFFSVTVAASSGGDVNFLTLRNSQNILVAITPVLLMGLGQTFVIISSGIDLSVGWVMGLSSVVSALVVVDLVAKGVAVEVAIVIGFVAGVAAATLVGFINGLIIALLKVPPFIVTLGTPFGSNVSRSTRNMRQLYYGIASRQPPSER